MPNITIGERFQRRNQRPVTIHEHPLVVGTHRLGVEIELENLPEAEDEFRSNYWEVKGDGSLRNNGREFVFRGPTGGLDLFNAVVELDTYLSGRRPDDSWRCSTHVHADVRGFNVRQLKLLILAFVVYEKVLFRLSGMHRYTNNFCCAVGFAQQQLTVLTRAWRHNTLEQFTNAVLGRWDKYSALNLLPITHFGSVEFRLSSPVWKKGKLLLLCNRYLALIELVKNWEGSEADLIEHLFNTPVTDVLRQGLPKTLPLELAEDLVVGYKLAYDILSFSTERPTFNLPAPNEIGTTLAARAAGNAGGHNRISEELFIDGSPSIGLSDNAVRYLRERLVAFHNIYAPPRLLRDHANASFMKWVCNLLDLRVSGLLTPAQYEVYNMWLEAGEPTEREDGGRFQGERAEGVAVDVEEAIPVPPNPEVPVGIAELLARGHVQIDLDAAAQAMANFNNRNVIQVNGGERALNAPEGLMVFEPQPAPVPVDLFEEVPIPDEDWEDHDDYEDGDVF